MKAINLLPPDQRGASKTPRKPKAVAADAPAGIGAYVVLGALAACVVALAAYVLTTNTVKDRQAKLEAVTAQAAATTQRAAQLKPYADFQAMAETRIQTVKDLASSRFDWEQAMRDVSRVIPADVTLSSLSGSVATGTGGSSTVRGAIAAPALELKGCTTGQKQVATLLSRLRNVDGVTRVSLNKSLKPAAAAAGAVASTTAPGGCGKGRPPAFEVVAFFEGSKVPASVQELTVEAAAGATPPAAAGTTPATGASATPTPTPTATPQGGGS